MIAVCDPIISAVDQSSLPLWKYFLQRPDQQFWNFTTKMKNKCMALEVVTCGHGFVFGYPGPMCTNQPQSNLRLDGSQQCRRMNIGPLYNRKPYQNIIFSPEDLPLISIAPWYLPSITMILICCIWNVEKQPYINKKNWSLQYHMCMWI